MSTGNFKNCKYPNNNIAGAAYCDGWDLLQGSFTQAPEGFTKRFYSAFTTGTGLDPNDYDGGIMSINGDSSNGVLSQVSKRDV